MRNHLLAISVTAALASPAYASIPLATYGASATLGQAVTPITINSVRHNPAAGYAALDHQNNESVRFGYWSQVGGTVEFGKVDNFQDDVDRLLDELDELDANPSIDDAELVRDEFNLLLESFGNDGNMNIAATVAVPGLPLAAKISSLPGVITLDASFSTFARVSFLDDPLELGSGGETGTLNTDSAILIQGVGIAQLTAGYSQSVFKASGKDALNGELVVGVRGNLYSASATRQVTAIDNDDDSSLSDLISDGLDENSKNSSAFGVDIGAIWLSDLYQVGLAGKNINSPELKIGSLQSNAVAQSFASELDIDGTYTLDPQFTLDASAFTQNKMVLLSASVDLSDVKDPLGRPYQMAHVAASFFPENTFIPTVRVGYQKNLAGEELSAVNFGVGFFRGVANLDFTYGLETVDVDGSTVPRQLGLNFSFEESF